MFPTYLPSEGECLLNKWLLQKLGGGVITLFKNVSSTITELMKENVCMKEKLKKQQQH